MDNTKRKELLVKITNALPIITMNREMISNIKEYYVNKNINSAVPMRIINKDADLGLLSDVDLCILIQAINLVPNNLGLNVEYYFHKNDIQLADSYKKDKIEKENTIVFKDVSKTNDKIYLSSKITFDEIVELASDSKIGYNFQTQREGKRIIKGDKIITIPTVNRKHVIDIMNSWKLGTFVPNIITFNIEHPLDIDYNPVNRTLKVTLSDDDYFAVVDGYHRTIAAINIKQQDQNFNMGFYYLRILNFTEIEAKQFIKQEDKHSPINTEHIKLLDFEDTSSQAVKYINDFGNVKINPLFHRFALKHSDLEIDKFCLFSTLSSALKQYFNINSLSPIESDEVRAMVLRGLAHIVSLFNKDFKNFKKSRQESVITMNGTFVFYVALLNELYKQGYHKQTQITDANKLETTIGNILTEIDFSFNNEMWKELNIIDKNNNMIIKKANLLESKKIMDYIDKTIYNESKVR